MVDRIEWVPVTGTKSKPVYLQATYRGMHCELLHSRRNVWQWSFYDDASPDPDLAVARGSHALFEQATREMLDYIDGYLPDPYGPDWAAFAEQNGLTMATVRDDDELMSNVATYAQHHCGGLFVLIAERSDGRLVKCHDSWGDDEHVVVHVYDPDSEDEDPTEEVIEFRRGIDAVRTFLAMAERG